MGEKNDKGKPVAKPTRITIEWKDADAPVKLRACSVLLRFSGA